MSIQSQEVLATLIPQKTLTILNIQRKLGHVELEVTSRNYEQKAFDDMKGWGVYDTKNQVFKKRCVECTFYPFSIILEQGGRIEVIAPSFASFQKWVAGLNALAKYKKWLSKIRPRNSSYGGPS